MSRTHVAISKRTLALVVVHNGLVWRLPRACCRQSLETLRPVTSAMSQVIDLDTVSSVLSGDCLRGAVGSDVTRCIELAAGSRTLSEVADSVAACGSHGAPRRQASTSCPA